MIDIKKALPESLLFYLRKWKKNSYELIFRKNLKRLAHFHNCDKWGAHKYTPHYDFHFRDLRRKNIKLLEIGVGGYDNPEIGGASLRMWKAYFRRGQIFGIDIYNKKKLAEDRIKIFQGDQTDFKFLKNISDENGEFDIIIDDGSHINSHIIKTFLFLFPKLKAEGYYVIEDLQSSYWHWYGGNSKDINDPSTAMNYFINLLHGLNHMEIIGKKQELNPFENEILSMHFYHNMLFIQKGDNTESSSFLIKNKLPESYK